MAVAKSTEINRLVVMRAFCSYNISKQTLMLSLDLDLILPTMRLLCTPVQAVPIVPTALSKNLAGPRSLSEVQGEPKAGLVAKYTKILQYENNNRKDFCLKIYNPRNYSSCNYLFSGIHSPCPLFFGLAGIILEILS